MIALELLKHEKELTYYKNMVECDFIINQKNSFLPIQSSYSLQNADTKKRELKGLISACEFLNVKKGIIVTYEEEYIEKINDIEIIIVPAYKFMLEIPSL